MEAIPTAPQVVHINKVELVEVVADKIVQITMADIILRVQALLALLQIFMEHLNIMAQVEMEVYQIRLLPEQLWLMLVKVAAAQVRL